MELSVEQRKDLEMIKEEKHIYNKNYYFKHTQNLSLKETKQQKRRRYSANIRLKLLNLLGMKCKRCGFHDVRALQIDHINGGGSIENKKYGKDLRHRQMIKSIERGEKKYQLLCANCNFIKRFENNEFDWRPRKKINN